jgi:hypothetical protein
MQHSQVLNICPSTNRDGLIVRSQHRAEPDAGGLRQCHSTNQRGIGCDPDISRLKYGLMFAQSDQHELWLSLLNTNYLSAECRQVLISLKAVVELMSFHNPKRQSGIDAAAFSTTIPRSRSGL